MSQQRFGRYILIKKIGEGGMAAIHKAWLIGAKGFTRPVALKMTHPHLSRDEDFIKAFEREAKLVSLINHPNIVQILDFGCENEMYYIAMEYIWGKDLKSILKRCKEMGKTMDPDFAAFFISLAAQGLDYSHNMTTVDNRPLNLVHRDISPQNILVSYEGETKVLDFGIAKVTAEETLGGNTQGDVLKGKVCYMSPEQAEGKTLDARSDLFSLGIVFFELITGKNPFAQKDLFLSLEKIRKADYLDSSSPVFAEELKGIFEKCLAKNPDLRYQTAADFHSDLEEFLLKRGKKISRKAVKGFMHELFSDEKKRDEQEGIAERKLIKKGEPLQENHLEETLVFPLHNKEKKVEPSPSKKKQSFSFSRLILASLFLLLLGLPILLWKSWLPENETKNTVSSNQTQSSSSKSGKPHLPKAAKPEKPVENTPVELSGQIPESQGKTRAASRKEKKKTTEAQNQKPDTLSAGTPPKAKRSIKTVIESDAKTVIRTTPEGARVAINDRFRGKSPLSYSLEKNQTIKITSVLDGYRKAVMVVTGPQQGELKIHLVKNSAYALYKKGRKMEKAASLLLHNFQKQKKPEVANQLEQNFKKIIETYMKATSEDPQFSIAFSAIGRVYYKKSKKNAAMEGFTTTMNLKNISNSLNYSQEALDLGNDPVGVSLALQNIGNITLYEGDQETDRAEKERLYKESIETFDEAIKSFNKAEGSPDYKSRDLAQTYLSRAVAFDKIAVLTNMTNPEDLDKVCSAWEEFYYHEEYYPGMTQNVVSSDFHNLAKERKKKYCLK